MEQGHSVGLFPEGRINRSSSELLAGNQGAARLSLKTKVPIVPAGISFPRADPLQPLPRDAAMRIKIGPPMYPSPELTEGKLRAERVSAWHDQAMQAIAQLSGKTYQPSARGESQPAAAR